MEIEYSREGVGKAYAYRFAVWEREAIARALVQEIKKRERQIQRVENDPKNEGQVTFLIKIEDLEFEIKSLREIIDEMKSNHK